MNKRLKHRFTLMSTGAMAIVLVFLLIFVSSLNSIILKRNQEESIGKIEDFITHSPIDLNQNIKPELFPIDTMKERFIVVETTNNEITISRNNFLDYFDDDEVLSISNSIIQKDKIEGIIDEFRYKQTNIEDKDYIILLSIQEQRELNKGLLIIFGTVSFVILILVFIVANILSKFAIKPFVENNEKQKRFITDASHELKTPLTAILTSTDVLLMDDKDNEWLLNIKEQSNRLANLVNKLVALTKLDEKKEINKKENTNISESAWEVIEPFEKMAKATNKEFVTEIEDNIDHVIDAAYFNELLSTLLDNALKYTNDKGQIKVSLNKKKDKPVLEVFNTCENLQIDNLNLLFDRFYRIDNSRNSKTGGSGIGLSIAKGLVENNGDKIEVSSTNKENITFKVIFK